MIKQKIKKKLKKNLDNKSSENNLSFPDQAPFSGEQKLWISAFMEGLKQGKKQNNSKRDGQKTLINFLYGTQTGNSEILARTASEIASKNDFDTSLNSLEDVSMDKLASMRNAVFIISTYGEGEMPDGAELFWESLSSEVAPKLHDMSFGVIALGDTSYEMFCNAGKLIDFRLEQLGAKRITKRVDCDVDYEEISTNWINSALPLFSNDKNMMVKGLETKDENVWNRKNPYFAEISKNVLLSGKGSNKQIRHFEIELSNSGIEYQVGDTLNIIPQNDKTLVDLILKRIGVEKNYKPSGFDNSIQFILLNEFEISSPSKHFIEGIVKLSKKNEFTSLINSEMKDKIDSFLWGKDILDLINLDPKLSISAEEFLSLLKPLQPRAYSISSSPKMHNKQVHLTISSVKWDYSDRVHKGVCSNYLAEAESNLTRTGIFLSPNNSFRLPDDDTKPVIMIGPGTGLAPFRAFLEERKVRGAKGKNWLFFGDQTRKNDFIYEDELLHFKKIGLLTSLDLAFSRDQKNKIYVQHRMLKSSKKFFKWIEDGAYLYVCGDATYMAKDVDAALHKIVQQEGGFKNDQTKAYIDQLKRNKRYLRDVY